ncbi:MAG: DUF1080 domain-containing protein [Verrucomicrobiota bacterium]
MKTPRPLPLSLLLSSALASSCLHAAEPIQLFNGTDLEGWSVKGGRATYEVVEGAIVGTTQPKSPNTFLCPEQTFSDFELTFEVQCDPKLNSGVQIRSIDSTENLPEELTGTTLKKASKRTKSGSLTGPQVEIAANNKAGSIYFEGVGGWLVEGSPKTAAKAYLKEDWNHYKIRVEGKRIRVWINDQLVTDGEDSTSHFSEGFLGFQVHSIKPGVGPFQVRWRNISLLPL